MMMGTQLLPFIIVRLVEQKVCGEFLVLVARKVGLDDQIALEAEPTEL